MRAPRQTNPDPLTLDLTLTLTLTLSPTLTLTLALAPDPNPNSDCYPNPNPNPNPHQARATADGARPFLPPPMRSFLTTDAKTPADVEAPAVAVAVAVSPPAAMRGVVVPTRRQRRVDAGASSARPRDDAVPRES